MQRLRNMFKRKILTTKDKGNICEDLACSYLKQEGYSILERNYRFRRYEIDIIAMKERLITFVEVKMEKSSLKNDSFWETPSDLKVNKRKRMNIINAAKQYLSSHNLHEVNYCFDIIRAIKRDSTYDVKHLKNSYNIHGDRNIIFQDCQ